MWLMSVTLDVSKASGWLNASAFCRVEGRADDAGRVAGREGRACEAAAARAERFRVGLRTGIYGDHGARAERTLNIESMLVTLDVLKVSDWLNADALCRVEGRADDVW